MRLPRLYHGATGKLLHLSFADSKNRGSLVEPFAESYQVTQTATANGARCIKPGGCPPGSISFLKEFLERTLEAHDATESIVGSQAGERGHAWSVVALMDVVQFSRDIEARDDIV